MQDLNKYIPAHVAIIMDGNRRWAKQKGLSHIEGHRESINRIKELIKQAANIGVKNLTLWAWSTKNWSRSADFIKDIFLVFRESLGLDEISRDAYENGIKISLIGRLDGFPQDIVDNVNKVLSRVPANPVMQLNLAIGYEGRDELIRTIKKIINENVPATEINPDKINQFLDTAGQPDVDLVIRTGGEKRTSGFLIWQAADAEYYFTDCLMPDFGVDEFNKAIEDFSRRERRLGGDSKSY